jgi:hypothetical protein
LEVSTVKSKTRPYLDANRCEGRGGGYNIEPLPPGKFSKKLVNKNAIKSMLGDPAPPNLGENLSYTLPWIYSPCVVIY